MPALLRRQGLSAALVGVAMPLMVALLAMAALVFAVDLVGMQRRNAARPPPTAAQRRAAAPAAETHWRQVQAALVRRLDQHAALDFGGVWSTRTGRICGTVNGRGSFGGWSGMKAFYADGDRLTFDEGDPNFQQAWFECGRDVWVELVAGADGRGGCVAGHTRRICRVAPA